MTTSHKLCAVISGPTYSAASSQIESSNDLAHLLEFRLDLLKDLSSKQLKHLQTQSSKPLILTIRNHLLSDPAYIHALITQLQPAYLDFEWNGPKDVIAQFQADFPNIKTICSYHDVSGSSQELETIYNTMQAMSADYYKIAVMSHSTLESLKMLHFLKENNQQNNLIGICMGEAGQITRILGPIFGNAITYAAPTGDSVIAPGQLDLITLLETYHHKHINQETALFGLIGNPVHYSVSHLSHNKVFRDIGCNAIYVKMNLLDPEFSASLDYLVKLGWKGLSVTMPFKETVLSCVAEGRDLPAVNTLQINKNTINGFNTDGSGALRALLKVTPLHNKQVVLLGAGGVAKAITQQLVIAGARVTILNRSIDKAKQLAQSVGGGFGALSSFGDVASGGYDILINCTSLGRKEGDCLINEMDLLPDRVVMDVLSTPRETSLIKAALAKRCQIVYGMDMFVFQAIDQFAIWLGDDVRDRVEKSLKQHICTMNTIHKFKAKQGMS